MNKQKLIVSLIATIVVVAISVGYLATGARPRLGLDLQGGISAIYSPVLEEGQERPEDFDAVLDETIAIIRERVDSLGVAEPDISRSGDDVLVQLPGLDDPERAREVIGTTAQLNFRPVEAIIPPGDPRYAETPDCDDPDFPVPAEDEPGVVCSGEDEGIPNVQQPVPAPTDDAAESPAEGASPSPAATDEDAALPTFRAASAGIVPLAQASPSPGETAEPSPGATATTPEIQIPTDAPTAPLKYQVGPAALTGDNVEGAQALFANDWSVSLDLDDEGAEKFAQITGELACRRDQGQIDQLAIVLDGRVESAPQMNPTVGCDVGITGGEASITVGGAGSPDAGEDDARSLALVLKTGALPITLEPSTFETVSATLGEDSLNSGLLAGLIGLAIVAIYLMFFYRLLGVIAIGALTIFGIVITAIITLMGEAGFTLTLAGIAGIVVSIGITADSSIIFFERIGDEVALGKTVRTSITRAFSSAFRTNLAGNTVTLAAAVILYFLAVGPVRGFAFTLGLAVILDIAILYFYSRSVTGLLAHGRRLTPKAIRAAKIAPAGGSK